MRWIYTLIIFSFILVMPVNAAGIGVEETDGSYILVFTSTEPHVISAYTIQLNYDPAISVLSIGAIEPFEVFSKIYPEEGYARISAFAMIPHAAGTRIPLARIQAESGFSPSVQVEFLEDFNRNPIPVNGMTNTGSDNETLPEYLPQNAEVPGTSAPVIPEEQRVYWTLPGEVHIPGAMPTIIPTTQPEIPLTNTPTREDEQVSSHGLEVSENPTSSSGLTDEESGIPAPITPLSFIPLFGGLMIVILITRSKA